MDGFGTDGSGDPEPTPDPGSIRGDGLPAGLDQSTDSTPDSNSAEFSRETSTVFPAAHAGDEATQAAGVLTPLSPTGGQAATDKTGTFQCFGLLQMRSGLLKGARLCLRC